jgi:glutamine synthetase
VAPNTHVPADQLEADIRDGTIDTVIVAFADHHGRLVGKRTDADFYRDVVAHHGTENCDYLIACDLDDVPIPGFAWASYDQGYGDMRGVVDPATIRYLPWLESTALVLVDLVDVDTGAPVDVSPRRVLQQQAEAAAALGYTSMIGSELEFFVFRESYDVANRNGYRELTPNSPWLEDYDILQTTKEEELIGRIRRGLRGAGLPVEFSKGEAGRGQHELNLTFQPALEMADTTVVFKNAVKEIAARSGQSVTFMAKPHFDDGGNSGHIHSSLWSGDGSRSVMAGDGDHLMSDVFRWYLGGLLATAREFSLLFAPNVNSYKRFQPGSWAPTSIGWATDNRTLGFRVVGHGAGMRVESRIPGADVNAYHAFAATIAGGLHGIRERIEPAAPYQGNGYAAQELPRIPTTFIEAIELWRTSDLAKKCFGDAVHHHVLHHAEFEWQAFNASVTDWERHRYFERI